MNIRLLLVTGLIFLGGLSILNGCDFLSPEPQKGDHYLFTGNFGYDEIFVVDLPSHKVVRKLQGFESVTGYSVSKDGKKLYVDARERKDENTYGKLFVVDLQTWQSKVVLHERAETFISPQGDVIVFTRKKDRVEQFIGRIDPLTDEVVFLDTLALRPVNYWEWVAFDPHRPLLYTVNSDHRLIAYDYQKAEVVRTYENIYDPLHMVISPDGKRLYVVGGPVFDLEEDVIIDWIPGNRRGSLALTPSGDTLLVTDPGGYLILLPHPPGKVFLYDTKKLQYFGEIDVEEASPYPGTGDLTDQVVISPDGRMAYVSNWGELVFVIDLKKGKVVDLITPQLRAMNTTPLRLVPKPRS